MSDSIADRLTQLEAAVRRATEAVARLREENDRLRRDNRRLEDERRQVLGQIDAVLRDIARLVLAALEIADDLHRAREEQTRDAGEVEARLGALVELLDRVAPDPPRRT